MSKEFIQEMNQSFARRSVHVFIDMAIRTADVLGINQFIIVPTDGDLNKAEVMLAGNVRYHRLPAGDIIIHSTAMQQLCIAKGLANALPWVQNVCNPRLRCSLVNGRVIADINRTLLQRAGVEVNPGPSCRYCLSAPVDCWACWACLVCCQCHTDILVCGDVESNPGPIRSLRSLFFCMSVVIVAGTICLYQPLWLRPLSKSEIGSIVPFAVEKPIVLNMVYYSVAAAQFVGRVSGLVIEPIYRPIRVYFLEWGLACAHTERARLDSIDAWRGVITGPFMYVLYSLGLVKSYSELITDGNICRIILQFHDPMLIHQVARTPFWWLRVFTYVILGVSGTVFFGFCWWTLWFLTRKHGVTTVVSPSRGLVVNKLKDHARKHFENFKPPVLPGQHYRLARERAAAEAWCFDQLLGKFQRVRDVGGSRSRWPELGYRKHLCSPVLVNADILREEKSENKFENCGQPGQFCPRRLEIPAAVLSHVDYYLTQRELVSVVTGPTFIINHDFTARPTKLGCDGEVFEATVVVTDDLVDMKPVDGTRFRHGYHRWSNEGSVVQDNGAFTYVRICKFGDTQIIYCVPADGVYRRNDDGALPNTTSMKITVGDGYLARYDTCNSVYVFDNVDLNHTFSVKASVVNETAVAFMTAPRDAKFVDTVRSYVSGKLRAEGIDLVHLDKIVRCVTVVADYKSIYDLPNLSVMVGDPRDFRLRDRLWYRVVLGVQSRLPGLPDTISNFLIRHRYGRVVAPWLFNTVHVPSYEVMAERRGARPISGRICDFNINRFRAEAAPINASRVKCGGGRTSEELPKCIDIIRDSGVESCTETSSVADLSLSDERSLLRENVAGTPSSSKADDSPRQSFTVAESLEESKDAGSEERGGASECSVRSHTVVTSRETSVRTDLSVYRPILVSEADDLSDVGGPIHFDVESPLLDQSKGNRLTVRLSEPVVQESLESYKRERRIGEICLLLEEVLNKSEPCRSDKIGGALQCTARFVLRCCCDPEFVAPNQSVVVQGTTILCHRVDGASPRSGGVRFRNLDFEISNSAEAPAVGSPRSRSTDGFEPKISRGQKFLENRNIHGKHRPKKHISKK